MDEAAETMSDAEMQRRFENGPRVSKGAVMILLGDRIYRREGNVWRLLDNRVHHSIKEMTGGSA